MFEYYSVSTNADPFISIHIEHCKQIGHDNIMSIVDDWGLGDDEKNPMNLEQLPLSRLSKLGFMFGGAGDGRLPIHVSITKSDTWWLYRFSFSSSSHFRLNHRAQESICDTG